MPKRVGDGGYRSLRTYRRLVGDRRYYLRGAAGEVKVEVRVTSVVGNKTYRTVETGTSFASPLDDEGFRTAKKNAVDDAVSHHVLDREDSVGPSGAIDGSGITTRESSIKQYGITDVTILRTSVRHRVPKNTRIKNEGDRVVWRDSRGQYISWNSRGDSADANRDNESYGFSKKKDLFDSMDSEV